MKTYNVQQIAEMLNTNPETVRRWIRDKKLIASKDSRKAGNIITEANLQRFLKSAPKYLPLYTAFMSVANPALTIPAVISGAVAGKLLNSKPEKSVVEGKITDIDVEQYLIENIQVQQKVIEKYNEKINELHEKKRAEEKKLEQYKTLLSNLMVLKSESKEEK